MVQNWSTSKVNKATSKFPIFQCINTARGRSTLVKKPNDEISPIPLVSDLPSIPDCLKYWWNPSGAGSKSGTWLTSGFMDMNAYRESCLRVFFFRAEGLKLINKIKKYHYSLSSISIAIVYFIYCVDIYKFVINWFWSSSYGFKLTSWWWTPWSYQVSMRVFILFVSCSISLVCILVW